MTALVRAAITTAGLAVSIAAPASAASPPAQTISQPHLSFDLSPVGYTAGGTAVAAWRWEEGRGGGVGDGHASARGRRLRRRARAAREHRLRPASLRLRTAHRRDLRTVRGNPTEGIESSTLRVRFGNLDGVFGQLAGHREQLALHRAPRLVVNRSGDAALAWWEGRGTPPTIYVSLRRRGGSFGAPIKIGQRGVGLTDHSVAIGENGDVLVAWEAAGRIARA